MATALIGRSAEIARLEGLGAARLVTIWGPGGVGKTRLAREHAERERKRRRDVVWIDLAAARTTRDTVLAVAAAFGVALGAGEDVTSDAIVDALARAGAARHALVVLDNVEQLDAGARAAVVRLALGGEARAGAGVLATSRELFGASDEVGIALEPLAEDDAVALFEELAGAGPSDLTRAIVRRLDALPLAIELAAARVPLLGASELLARLDRKLDVLGTAKADRPARHATLRAAIAWTWDLLDDFERDALMACAAFEAPFEAAAAEAVIGGPEAVALDRLERLRGRALVHAAVDATGRTRLRLLESVRDFARERSAEAGVTDAIAARHAAAIVARSEPLAEAARCGRDRLAELELLRAELVSVVGRPGTMRARATLSLAALLASTGPASSAIAILDVALREPDGDEARLLVAKGDALHALGRLADARTALERAAELARGDDDSRVRRLIDADAARVLGSVLRALGDVDAALAHKERALAIYRAIDDRAREGICLGELGAVHQSEGRLELARRCHAEAIAIHVAMGSRRAEGVERSYLAVATHRAGDPARSVLLHERALAIHREVGHRRLEGAELLHLGFVRHELGALTASRESLATARHVLASAAARGLEAIAAVFAARLEVDAGDPTAALLLLAEAMRVAPVSWPRLAATHHLVEGHLAMATGSPERARTSYEAALATNRDLEVGFEALTSAYLALAIARCAGERSRIDGQLASARTRVVPLENPHLRIALAVLESASRGVALPEVASAATAASSEVRRALAFAGALLALVVEDEGRRVVLPDGRAIDLSRRKNVRLVLCALARARRDAPGVVVSPEALLAAGWAGEKMRADAATKRLHTAIWTLRSVGFEALLVTEGEGYMLDPRVAISP